MRWTVSLLLALWLASPASATPAKAGRVGAATRPAGDQSPASAAGGGGPTTTTLPPGAPSWVSASLGAWMLDEASGTRVNLQGTATRDLDTNGGPIGNSTSQKMEGTASVDLTASSLWLSSIDTALKGLTSPFTCVGWARSSQTGDSNILSSSDATGSTGVGPVVMWRYSGGTGKYELRTYRTNNWDQVSTSTFATDTWVHFGAIQNGTTCTTYRNGAVDGTGACTVVVQNGSVPFRLGGPQLFVGTGFVGQLDEVACFTSVLSAASICRICSCGVRGEQCVCSGAAFTSSGRNVTSCGSCTLPANCSAAAPS